MSSGDENHQGTDSGGYSNTINGDDRGTTSLAHDSLTAEVDVWTSSHRSCGILEGCFKKLIFAILSCIIGSSFQFGYHTGVVNLPQTIFEHFINDSIYYHQKKYVSAKTLPVIWGFTVSIYCVGGMIGGLLVSQLTQKFGRKQTLLLNNIPTVVALALMCFSQIAYSFEMIIVGRFIMGISAGVSTSVAPMYLSEIAPLHMRGVISTINQCAILMGIIVSQIMGLQSVIGNKNLWPLIFGVSIIPVIIQMLSLPWCPETPHHLIMHDEDEAEASLVWLRGTHDVGYELEELRVIKEESKHKPQTTFNDLFRKPHLRKPLFIVIMMMLSQQLSGINAVTFYSTSIFRSVKLSQNIAQLATILITVLNLLVTSASAVLIDRLGRRMLHLTGMQGMFLSSIVVIVGIVLKQKASWLPYLTVAGICLYIIFFAIGPGSIPWFIGAEIFLQGPRDVAMSIGVTVNWLANFLVGIAYPPLQKAIGGYSFLPFTIFLFLFSIYTYFKVPETKGKKVEDTVAEFVREENSQARVLL